MMKSRSCNACMTKGKNMKGTIKEAAGYAERKQNMARIR